MKKHPCLRSGPPAAVLIGVACVFALAPACDDGGGADRAGGGGDEGGPAAHGPSGDEADGGGGEGGGGEAVGAEAGNGDGQDDVGADGSAEDPGIPGLPDSCEGALPVPGLKTLHRLNRAEYDNTVRDLLGDATGPARDFPADDHGHGFDNQADVLSVGALLAEKYDIAAQRLVDDALVVPRTEPDVFEFEAEEVGAEVGAAYRGFGWNLWSNGEMRVQVTLAEAGDYRISVHAFGQQAGPELVRMQVAFDNIPVQEFEVAATADEPATYSARVDAGAGSHSVSVSFLNDFYQPDEGLDRNLILDWIEVRGPMNPPPMANPEARARIVTCDPALMDETDCARQVFAGFGRRAWRRPLTLEEMARLAGFLDIAQGQGGSWEDGVRLGLQAILLSPHFLFRVEVDPDPSDPAAHPISDHELAARLSYFLWSSMPDEALDAAADAGGLNEPAAITAQLDRMLADDKARALVDNFAGQWLFLRALDDLDPDYQKYPGFDEELRASMRAETEAFFESFLDSDASALDMLDAGFSFIDDRLARHYGLPEVGGEGLTRITELGPGRAGLLTQASVLSVTSNRTRTSPVKRGLWVLANMLCTEPPPPPPDVPVLEEPVDPDSSLRDRMEQHRADPQCAGCHALMDPIGFSFEHFDAIGAWRDDDEGFAIDDSGALPGDLQFSGADELSTLLKADERVARCIAGKLSTYGMGRGEDRRRQCGVDKLTQDWADRGYRLRALIEGLAQSPQFRQRRPQIDDEAGGQR